LFDPQTAVSPYSAASNGMGGYTITNLPPGAYVILVRAMGFAPQMYAYVDAPQQATIVSVDTGSAARIDFSLRLAAAAFPKKGGVSGKALAKINGQPIAGIIVGALAIDSSLSYVNSPGFNPQYSYTPYNDTTRTDGSYAIQNMPQGAYIVFAKGQNYLPQFYLNADSAAQAKRMYVDSNGFTSIDFTLRSGGSISGRVMTAQGNPMVNISVNVNGSMGNFSSWAMTDSAGKFLITGLPAGTYCINANSASFLMNQDTNQCRYTVAEGGTLSGITLTVRQGGFIGGTYAAPRDSMYDPGFEIALFSDTLMSKDGTLWESGTAWASVFTNNGGAYFVSGPIPPGAWKFLLRPSSLRKTQSSITLPYVATKAYSFGNAARFSAQTPIKVTEGDTTFLTGVNFGIGYSVFGRISLEGGEKNIWCTITAFVKDSGFFIPICRTSVASDSMFEMPGLIDGQDYYIRVDAPNYPSQYWSPAGAAVEPANPYHFSTGSFVEPVVRVVQNPQGLVVAPPSLSAWFFYSDTGGLRIQCNASSARMGIDSLVLYSKDVYGDIITAAVFPSMPQTMQYTWNETRDLTQGPYYYAFVGKGAAASLRSNVVYYYPMKFQSIPSDSLRLSITPGRTGVRINWAADSAFVATYLDTTVLYRKRTGDSALTPYQKAWGAGGGFFDGSWDKTKDVGVTAWYQVKMFVAGRVIKQSAIQSFTASQAFINHMANQLSVGPTMKYTAIQQAIDAAQDFDVINVEPGVYRENLNWKGKTVSLQGNWSGGTAPVIDGNGGVAVTIPYTSKSMDRDNISISGFKFQYCPTAIASSANINVNQCLFVSVVKDAIQCVADSAAVAMAGLTDPFAQFQVSQNIGQCTFIGKGSGPIALRAYSKTGAPAVDTVNAMVGTSMTPGGRIGVNNSIFAYYASDAFPAAVTGSAFNVDLQNCDLWQTSKIPPSKQVSVGAAAIAVDPAFIDTVNYFLSDNSPLKNSTAANGYYGYDGRRFYYQKTDQPVIPAVAGFKAAVAGQRKIALSWSPLPDTVKIVGYIVFRISGYDSLFSVDANSQWKPKIPDSLIFSIVDTFRTGVTHYIDSTLIVGKPYIYAVAGISADGNIGKVNLPFPPPLSAYIIKIDPPSSVPMLTATAVGFSAIALQWKKPSFAKTAAPAYSFYRIAGGDDLFTIGEDSAAVRTLVRQSASNAASKSFSTQDTSFYDNAVLMNAPYMYVVSVFDSSVSFEQRPLTWTVAKIDTALYRPLRTVKLHAGQWSMIGPWGVGALPFNDTSSVAYRWNDAKTPDKLYSQYVTANALQAGAGYWVNAGVDTAISIDDSMFSAMIKQRDSIGITLIKGLTGWNQIASPFPFPVAPKWLDGTVYTAYAWNGDSSQYVEQTHIKPWQACWLHIDRDTQLVFRASDVAREAYIRPLGKHLKQAAWELKVALTGASNDPDNYIGVVPGNAHASIRLASPKPPQAFDFPQLYLLNGKGQNGGAAQCDKLSKLYKASAAVPVKKIEWMVGVSPSEKAMKIKVTGSASTPDKVYLFWVTAHSVVNLREKADIDVAAHKEPLYGYIVATADPRDLALYSNRVELRRGFPNPFRKSTTIEFVVPYAWNADGSKKEGETRDLSLAVFNCAGRRVAVILSGHVEVGEHRVVWNGLTEGGSPLSPGIFITRLSGGDFQRTMKIFKVR
jgi:hypothetical protein